MKACSKYCVMTSKDRILTALRSAGRRLFFLGRSRSPLGLVSTKEQTFYKFDWIFLPNLPHVPKLCFI